MTALLLRIFVPKDLSGVAARRRVGFLAGFVGIALNLLLFSGKLWAGLRSGSVAVVADAVNSLSDAFSCVATLIGFYMASRPADREHPYGHARAEYLAGLAVAASILLIGVELARSSLGKIFTPEAVTFSLPMFLVLAASMLAKLWMWRFLRHLGKRIDSTVLTASASDSLCDAISTGAVLSGSALGLWLSWPLDGYLGLAVAVFIFVSGVRAAKETIDPLLGSQADPEMVRKLLALVRAHEPVLGIHDLLVHDYGPGQCYASLHVELDATLGALDRHEIIDNIEREALGQLNVRLIIHDDPVDVTCDRQDAVKR